MRWPSRLLIAVLAFHGVTSSAWAQRREVVDELLRALIESQLNRGRPPQPAPQPAPQPEVAPRPRPDSPTRAARMEIQAMSTDAMQLAQSLQIEARSQPQLRGQLGRLIQVQAALDAQSVGRGGHSLEQLALDYAAIDRDWRSIEYQLQQFPDLTPRSKLLAKAVSDHDRQLCQMLGI